MKVRLPLLVLIAGLFLAISGVSAEEDAGAVRYTYLHKGKPVSLSASSRLIAVQEDGANLSAFATQHRLAQDPLSERHELKRHRLKLYRASGAAPTSRALKAASLAAATTAPVQPVFEQGGALLIPTDEVIVGFKSDTSLAQAQGHLAAVADTLGIVGLKEHRRNIFIATISNPTNGRAFLVAHGVAALQQVAFCEPNFVTVHLTGKASNLQYDKSPELQNLSAAKMKAVPVQQGEGQGEAPLGFSTTPPSAPGWTVLAELGFETDALPQGWGASYVTGRPAAYWGPTSYRRHGGTRSLYCTAKGAQGGAAPGPAAANALAVLYSPQMDLSRYNEVYLELWFYAKNELDSSGLHDAAIVGVIDDTSSTGTGSVLAIPYDGDCTKDPTTAGGWRRLLFRVPPSFRSSNAHFEVQFISNTTNRTEGTYIDDLRIVATTNQDTAPLSSDPYSGRQYELRNVGQIAGLSTDRSDLHIPEAWDQVPVSPDVVVAVIDNGVEPTHPDLNLVTGYDYDGSIGGQPRIVDGERGGHGTNCAGNIGAIKDNGIGVAGTAPGVKIMPIYYGTQTADAANAIDVAVRHGAKVLSNSWGWTGAPSADVEDAVKGALAAGSVVLFAAGNGPDREPWSYDVAFPGRLTETTDVICVGASSPTDEHKGAASSDGEFMWGSSYVGPGPDVVAPSSWSYTTDLIGADGDNDGSALPASESNSASYNPAFTGTSSATPKVAGVVALMLSKNPNLTPSQVKSLLMSSADDIDAPGIDDKTGAGRVNAYRAVLAVPAPTVPADTTPPAVTATQPANGAASVPLQTGITASFNVSMDPSTLTSSAFTVDNGVTGTVSYNSSTRTATFTPSRPLSTARTYTATIGTGARSASGVALAAPQSWSFRTTSDSALTLLVNGSFESGTSGWTGADSVASGGIVNQGGSGHGGSNWYLVAGNGDSINSAIYQDFAVPAGSHPSLRFWYKVITAERTTTNRYDTLTVQLKNPATGAVLQPLKQLSNLDAGPSWVQSEEFDLSPYAGRQLRLEFKVSTDESVATSFLVDDVTAAVPGTSDSTDPADLARKKFSKSLPLLLLLFGEDGSTRRSR